MSTLESDVKAVGIFKIFMYLLTNVQDFGMLILGRVLVLAPSTLGHLQALLLTLLLFLMSGWTGYEEMMISRVGRPRKLRK